jgi:hypothetical protein
MKGFQETSRRKGRVRTADCSDDIVDPAGDEIRQSGSSCGDLGFERVKSGAPLATV